MRLRSNAPFEPTSLNPRITIATYSDGRAVGYDPRSNSGFDVAGLSVSANDVIAYDRLGSLTWNGEEWREWVYAQVGLAVPSDEDEPVLPTFVPQGAPPAEAKKHRPGLSMLAVAAFLVAGCVGAFYLGTLMTPPAATGPLAQRPSPSPSEPARSASATSGIERDASDFVPAYVVVSSSVESGVGRVGNVLITSADAGSSVTRHRDICRAIAVREKFSVVRLFRTADAYVAMRDARFREENPEALPFGYLGIMVDDGTFYSSDELNGNTAIPRR